MRHPCSRRTRAHNATGTVARAHAHDAINPMMQRPPNPFAPRTYGQLEAVTPRVFIWRNIVNSTVFVGENAVAVVDTQVNQALARRLRDTVAERFGKPIRYAINTHYHWDHAAGNQVFADAGATVIASRRTAAALVERMPRQKAFLSSRGFDLGPDPRQPDAFSDDLRSLDLGGLTLDFHLGHDAETADPTLVWCAQERVLAAGDTVMTGSFPIFGQPSQNEGLQNGDWLTALEEVRGFGAEHVMPGHGPVAHAEELAQLETICRYFLDTVKTHHAAGRTLDETIRVMEHDLPAWLMKIPEVWGTPRYAILRVWAGLADLGQPGWQHVKPSAIPRAPGVPLPESDRFEPWAQRSQQMFEGGDAAGAVSTAEAATLAFPEHPGAWTTLAAALIAASRGIASVLEKGDCFDAARHAIDRALTLSPGYGPALLQRGQFHVMVAYRNGDDPRTGEAFLDQAEADARLTPRQLAEVAFYRGIAARARGDEAGALAGFQAALARDAGFRPALLAQMP